MTKRCLLPLVILFFTATCARGQERVHLLHAGKLPPGAIGSQQLLRGGPLGGYFQPVEIKAPQDALVSVAVDHQFSVPQRTPLKVGMLVAPVYRLRVTQIPNHVGEEVFPTVEIINRIYPPVGEEFRFPIPIELTQADLELALDGKFVTRVVYLEDPQQALPVAPAPDGQQYFEVRPSDDPLEVADRLGRPVAIIRLGGRLPDAAGPDERFLFGSPPLLVPNSLDLFGERDHGIRSPEATTSNRPKRKVLDDTEVEPLDPRGRDTTPTVRVAASRSGVLDKKTPDGRPAARLADYHEWKLNEPAPVGVSVSDDE